MSEIFDFNTVPSAESAKFLTPGIHKLSVTDVKYNAEGKTPFLQISFASQDGTMREKFYVTAKTLPRLQYLHEGWVGKKIAKAFNSSEDVGLYFTKLFQSDQAKAISHNVLVSGEEAPDGKVYTKFGYADFILEDSAIPSVFEPGSREWAMNVKKQTNAATASNSMNLGPTPSSTPAVDDLPF